MSQHEVICMEDVSISLKLFLICSMEALSNQSKPYSDGNNSEVQMSPSATSRQLDLPS